MPSLTCPECGERFQSRSSAQPVRCPACRHRFNPPARRGGPRGREPATGLPVAPWLLVAGAAGLALVLLVAGVGLWWLLGGKGKQGPAGGDDVAASHDFVAVSESSVQPNAAKPLGFAKPSPIVPAAADDSPLPPLPKLVDLSTSGPAKAGAAFAGIPADQAKEPHPPWPKDFAVPARAIQVVSTVSQPLPTLSAPGGRYAVFANAIDSSYRLIAVGDPRVPGRSYLTPNNVPKTPPPLALTDLGSGEKVGTFAWNVPLMKEGCRLAPDGGYLVSNAGDGRSADTCLLDVWKKGAGDPAGQLKITGQVRWAEFVAPTRIAFVVHAAETSLQVWDVAQRKVVHTLPVKQAAPKNMPGQSRPARNFIWGVPDGAPYWPVRPQAALSAGGRYVAVGGTEDVVLFDLQTARELGRLPLPTNLRSGAYLALGFFPETNQLVALLQEGVTRWLLAWDLTTGRERYRTQVHLLPGRTTVLYGDLYPGPLPDTFLIAGWHPGFVNRGASLIDARSGNVVHTLDYALLGPPIKGQVLACAALPVARKIVPRVLDPFKDLHETTLVTFTTSFDSSALEKMAAPWMKAVTVRPAVPPGTRTVAVTRPAPPAKWAAPKASPWSRPDAGSAWLPQWPGAFADSVAAVLRYVPHEKPLPRNEIVCQRLDLATGKLVGSFQLWPWALNPLTDPDGLRTGRVAAYPDMPPAALTADGERLAFVDPNERNRLDVWNAKGERLLGFYAAPPGQDIVWVGWSAAGHLLTVAGGLLTAWDPAGAKALFAVHGGYEGKCELARGRQWGVFAAPGRIDVIDVAGGKCLGRCRARGLSGAYEAVRLSPDGSRLLAVVKGSAAGAKYAYSGWVWDLKDGSARQFGWGDPKAFFRHLQGSGWVSPDQFVMCNDVPALFDLVAGGQVTGLDSFARLGLADKAPWFATSPDGRLWVHWRNAKPTPQRPGPWCWQPLALPEAASSLLDPAREFLELAKVPLMVEVDLGNRTLSREAAQKIADELAGRGFTIGKGGWRLRLYHGHSDAGATLTGGSHGEVKIPMVVFTWDLVSPGGGKAWSTTDKQGLLGNGSKYYKGSKNVGPIVGPGSGGRIDHYDFGSRNPKAAATEEILEYKVKNLKAPEVPLWLVSAGKGAARLPAGGKWAAR